MRQYVVVIASATLVACVGHAAQASAQGNPAGFVPAAIDALYPSVEALYTDLHQHPELSGEEVETAAKLAESLRRLGYEVTTGVGGTGVVALLRNGPGPTVALRTELDALPIEEKTGLPFASKVVAVHGDTKVPVMHACGHDLHMASLVGAATILAQHKDRWRGTVFLIGQPAEETVLGAKAMLADGLFTRFPKPDFVIAIHDSPALPAGKVGITPGAAQASVDKLLLTIYGEGGHGGHPHRAVDPIIIASRVVLGFQTIVSRENDPLDPAVVTVGSFHGGTSGSIIPDEVRLQLSVRALKEDVRDHMLAAIQRIAKAEANASGAPREPELAVESATPVTFNDAALTKRLNGVLRRAFGEANVVELPPIMAAEDFGLYGREHIPVVMIRVGAIEPRRFEEAQASKTQLPANHSPQWAPDRERTLRAGVRALSFASLDLLGNP